MDQKVQGRDNKMVSRKFFGDNVRVVGDEGVE